MTTTRKIRKLSLERETLRTLSTGELERAHGGKVRNNCTARISGCIIEEKPLTDTIEK